MSKSNVTRDIAITSKYIPVMAGFIAKGDIRYYLNALHVEPHPDGGILLVATDGHALAVIHDLEGKSNGTWLCKIPEKIIKACAKRGVRKSPFSTPKVLRLVGNAGYVLSVDDADPLEISQFHLETAYCEIVDGKFPEWKRVIPQSFTPSKKIGVNIALLSRVEKAIKGSAFSHGRGVEIFVNDVNAGFIVRPASIQELLVLVMPMRVDDESSKALPNWLEPLLPAIEEKQEAA